MKIHIPEQMFEIDETGYGRIKFDLACEEQCAVAPEPSVDSSVESESMVAVQGSVEAGIEPVPEAEATV